MPYKNPYMSDLINSWSGNRTLSKTEGSQLWTPKSIAFCCKEAVPQERLVGYFGVSPEYLVFVWFPLLSNDFFGFRLTSGFPWISFVNLCPWSSWQPRASRRLHKSVKNGHSLLTAPDGKLSEDGFLIDLWTSMDFLWISRGILLCMDILPFHWFCIG